MVISEKTIYLNVDLKNKKEVFRFLSQKARELNIVKDEQETINDLIAREEQVSTGLKDSFAIPHCKSQNVNQASLFYLELKKPIEWKTFDNSDVKYVFCIMAPEKGSDINHLQLLSKIASNLIEEDFRDELAKTNDKTKIKNIIKGE